MGVRVTDWSHLTWSGRWSFLWLTIRHRVVAPAPPHERCFMGAPVGEHVQCPRRALFDLYGRHRPYGPGVWCRFHRPRRTER